MKIFNLPDLGEGLPDAEIINWHVKVGDQIKTDQLLVSVETAKAIIDVPSPQNGIIEKLCANVGELVNTGQPLVIFKEDLGTVVGNIQPKEAILLNNISNNTIGNDTNNNINITSNDLASNSNNKINNTNLKATPAIRALATKLKLDLNTITPTGPNNTITQKDLEKAANANTCSSLNNLNLNKFDDWTNLHNTARSMALLMEKSQTETVPTTIFEDLILSNYKNIKDFDITVDLIQAIGIAAAKEPSLNAWFIKEHNNFKQKLLKKINLGIAIDSPEGLFVPVIENIAAKTPKHLREELNLLRQQIANRSVKPEQLQDATFILSNFGKFTGRYATPVIVPPMVAILAVGRLRQEPVVLNEVITVSHVLPLSLTFDHRAVTGGQAVRFLAEIIEFFK